MSMSHICIHGHFYQPPRENPWLEEIEPQDSAHPHHDWNEKITAECYAPNTASHILDSGKIVEIINNYEKISFDFGPTLLSWMEKHAPEVYKVIIEADKKGVKKFSGHGPAIAQAYNHMIMPLANSRDKRTQIIWGIKDFEHRFGRKPEGMWIPETAVDLETLDMMAEHGIKFTILSPYQARRVRRIGDKKWEDVSRGNIDPKMPYVCRLPSGRTINLFFYDRGISHDVAFGGLLSDGKIFAKRLISAFSKTQEQPQVVNIVTDGETYGHHFRFGDMGLAYCLRYIESKNLAEITVYGEYLEKFPPTFEVEIAENSSWGCSHGVERWRTGCGCNTGKYPKWNQKWRAPLREAMDWLRDAITPIYEKEMTNYVRDPWQARDDYIEVVLDRSAQNLDLFFSKHAVRELSKEEKVRALKLLETQRHAMLMYTSCGWYFDEISEVGTVQILQYAARVMQLVEEMSRVDLESGFLKILERAPSNIHEIANGARVYEMFVKPSIVDLLRVGAHFAISSLFEEHPKITKIYSYTVSSEVHELVKDEKRKLVVGRARIRSDITLEEDDACFAVLCPEGHDLIGQVNRCEESGPFLNMQREIKDAFSRGDVSEILRLMGRYIGGRECSLWDLFEDERRRILDQIIEASLKGPEILFRRMYERYRPTMLVLKEAKIPLPKTFTTFTEFVLNFDLCKSLERGELDSVQKLVEEIKRWSCEPDKSTLGYIASKKITALMEKLPQAPEDISLLKLIKDWLAVSSALQLKLDIWKAQNIYLSIDKQFSGPMRKKAEKEDEVANEWVKHFDDVGHYLGVKST